MVEKRTANNRSGHAAKQLAWAADEQSGKVAHLPRRLQTVERLRLGQIIDAESVRIGVGLVVAVLGPVALFTVALNSWLILGLATCAYLVGCALGAALIMKVRKHSKATSVVPGASQGRWLGIKNVEQEQPKITKAGNQAA